jgi:hypothetical protein
MAAAYPPSRAAHVSAAALPDDDRTVHAPDDKPTFGSRRVSGAGIAVGFGGSARRADLVAGVAGLDS